MPDGLTNDQRKRRIKELRESLARGCAGPVKFARRTLTSWMKELRRLEKEQRKS